MLGALRTSRGGDIEYCISLDMASLNDGSAARLADGRTVGWMTVRTCRQVPSSVPVLKWNEQNCLSGTEGGSLFPQPAQWLEDLLSVALSGRTQAMVSQISGVTYVTGAVRKGMETKCPASGFFFFLTCVLQDHTIILIFLPQRNQNKLCLQRKDFTCCCCCV